MHTARRGQATEMVLTPQLCADLLAADGDVVSICDGLGRVQWVNDAVHDAFGWTPDQYVLVGPHLAHADDEATLAAGMTTALQQGGHHRLEPVRLLDADGAWKRYETTVVNLIADHGVAVVRYRSLVERTNVSAAPVQVDEVTGLPRRKTAQAELDERLRQASQPVGVLFLDLDGFKVVNDRFGHNAGDRVLREVVDRLRHRLRDTELLARWGGDEFVVLVEVPGMALATTVAARLHTAIAEAPYEVDGVRISLGVSIGVAISEHGETTATDLVGAADHAMYEAKRSGGGIVAADIAA